MRVLRASVMLQDGAVVHDRELTCLRAYVHVAVVHCSGKALFTLFGPGRGTVLCALCAMIKYICTSSEKGLFLVGFITVF